MDWTLLHSDNYQMCRVCDIYKLQSDVPMITQTIIYDGVLGDPYHQISAIYVRPYREIEDRF